MEAFLTHFFLSSIKVFSVLLTFLQIGQSEIMLNHVFASLRSFIHKVCLELFLITFYFVFMTVVKNTSVRVTILSN